MGDIPQPSGAQPLDIIATGLAQDEHQGHLNSASNSKSPASNTPFYSQLSAIPQAQPRPDLRSPAHPQSPHYPAQDHGSTSMNMGALAGALPDYASVNAPQGNPSMQQHDQRQLSGASTSALVYQLQQNLQVAGPGSAPLPAHYGPGFNTGQFQQTFVPSQGPQHHNFAQFPAGQQRVSPQGPMPTPYQNFLQHSQFVYYPGPYGPQAQYSQGYTGQGNQPPSTYGRRQSGEMPQQEGGFSGSRMPHSNIPGDPGAMQPVFGAPFVPAPGYQRGPASSIPRGPPRKPKQSGHALWVGNLPPGTTVVALKDHFSRDATKDIESLFLISKSNCAFVNYRTEASCTAAMHRFHDSRFNGVRLVCRLRRSSAPASGVPTGPSAMVGSQPSGGSPPRSPREGLAEAAQAEGDTTAGKSNEQAVETTTSLEKYFIVKSLTLQDLELSVRNGIWATQSHNEETLNKAFENVYLIFSANKSGEYFGYARMASRILEDDAQLVSSAPKPGPNIDATDVPKSIPTPATEFAPKGRIIDDSARGTIFWEAELTESEGEEESGEKEEQQQQQQQQQEQQVEGEASGVAQSWGKPFKIEWISTNRLPFYRTRGLRNPWNANREVKIARDGTELEPSVGERLLQMFHRLGPSTSVAPMMPPQLGIGGPQMRQY